MALEWRVEVDTARDNTWATDITAHVKEADWELGMNAAFELMAGDTSANLLVDNTDGRFNPENASGAHYPNMKPHRRLRIIAQTPGSSHQLYAKKVTNGLIQYLAMNEPSGTTADDLSAEANDASYSDVILGNTPSPVAGDRAPFFGDELGTVNLYSTALANDFNPLAGTLVIWGQVNDLAVWSDGAYGHLARLAVDDNNYVRIAKADFTNVVFWDYMAGGTLKRILKEPVSPTDWFCMAMSWDVANDAFKAYWNGVQEGSTQTGLGTWAGTLTANNCALGAIQALGAFHWNGWLSHYRLYNRALSAAEIADLALDGDKIMWVGWIKSIKPDYVPSGAYTGKTLAKIQCEGIKSRLESVTIDLGLYENVSGDVVVQDALQQAAPPPAMGGVWLAGIVGSSEAGVTTFAGSVSGYSSIEGGRATFDLLGDKENTAWQAIKLVTEGERGFFYIRRDGKAVWNNRHHRLTTTHSEKAISNSANKPIKVDYAYDVESIKNIIRVTARPRKQAANTTVYELQEDVSVNSGAIKEFEVPLRDADGQWAGAKNLLASGASFSGATPTLTLENLGDRAKVKLDNSGNTAVATMTALPVTGDPVQDRNPIIAIAEDADSIGEHGRRELAFSVDALSALDRVESIAQFELLRRKDGRASIPQLRFRNKGTGVDNALQLALTIDSRITLTLSNGHSADHFIVGEKHNLQLPGQNPVHDTSFYLEPAGASQFWLAGVAGYSEAGQTTYGGY